jgi:Coiled-coil receptor-binding R-domain of colicin E2
VARREDARSSSAGAATSLMAPTSLSVPAVYRRIITRSQLKLARRLLLALCALLFLTATTTWGNFRRFSEGPIRANEAKLVSLMTTPTVLDRFVRSSGIRYVMLKDPLFTDAGFSYRETIDGEKRTVTEFKYIVLADRVLLARTKPGQPGITAGVLKTLPDDLVELAEEGALRFGKKEQLAPFLFDTTDAPNARLGLRIAVVTFLLTLLIGLIAKALWLGVRPRKSRFVQQLAADDPGRSELMRAAETKISKLTVGDTVVSDGLVMYRGANEFAIANIDDVVWAYQGPPKKRGVGALQSVMTIVVYTKSKKVVSIPVRSNMVGQRLIDEMRVVNPALIVGYYVYLSSSWKNNPDDVLAIYRARQGLVDSYGGAAAVRENAAFQANLSFAEIPRYVWQPAFATAPGLSTSSTSPRKDNLQRATPALVAGAVSVGALLFGLAAPSVAEPSIPKSWDPRVIDLVHFIEKDRGIPFKHPVPVSVLSPEQYDRISGNNRGDFVPKCRALKGCFDAKESSDPRREMFELLGMRSSRPTESTSREPSLGFYSLVDKQLFVRGTLKKADAKSIGDAAVTYVLVHELTHAWQDQVKTISLGNADETEEEAIGQTSLVEANASLVADHYLGTLSDADRSTALKGTSGGGFPRRSGYDRMSVLAQILPYTAGATYYKEMAQEFDYDPFSRLIDTPPKAIATLLGLKSKSNAGTSSEPLRYVPPVITKQADGERVVYTEQLTLLSYFALIADQQSASFEELGAYWRGAKATLVTQGEKRCATITIRAADSFPDSLLPHLLQLRTSSDKPSIDEAVDFRGRLKKKSTTLANDAAILELRSTSTEPMCTKVSDTDSRRTGDPEATQRLLNQWSTASIFAFTDITTAQQDRCIGKEFDRFSTSAYDLAPLTAEQLAIVTKTCELSPDILRGF